MAAVATKMVASAQRSDVIWDAEATVDAHFNPVLFSKERIL